MMCSNESSVDRTVVDTQTCNSDTLNSDVKKSKTLNAFKIKLKETTIVTYG